MERKLDFSVDEFYHIYNRGNNKSIIFTNDADKQRFVKLLYVCNNKKPVIFKTIQGHPLDKIEREETLVEIGAYCLMPNHFHLLLHEKTENGISKFMEKISTSYSMYFNKKYNRTGKLFENRFKANHIGIDRYFKYLFSYIHLNPIKIIDPKWKESGVADIKTALKYLDTYKWSSYDDHRGVIRPENIILDLKNFPEYFSNKKEFDSDIFSWLEYKE